MVMFFAVIFVGFKVFSTIRSNLIHERISLIDIQDISINGGKITNPQELQNIVKWFNSISNVNENPDFAGTTSSSSIDIVLKSDEKIRISYPGKINQDFEIQRNNKKGKWISYWGNQSDIKNILQEAAK